MDLNSIGIFVKVVELGSFIEAARALGVPRSTVSDKVTELEKSLGNTLLVRTTRKLNMTEVGRRFFEDAKAAIDQLQVSTKEASVYQKSPVGKIKIIVPREMVLDFIADAIREYKLKFPEVVVELVYSNQVINVIKESCDINIKFGDVLDASLEVRTIGSGKLILVGSPFYLENKPIMKKPKDLESLRCLVCEELQGEGGWQLSHKSGKKFVFRPTPFMKVNCIKLLQELVEKGAGVSILPDMFCTRALASQELVRLLPDWATTKIEIHLVTPKLKHSNIKVMGMLDILEKRLKGMVV